MEVIAAPFDRAMMTMPWEDFVVMLAEKILDRPQCPVLIPAQAEKLLLPAVNAVLSRLQPGDGDRAPIAHHPLHPPGLF